MQMRREKVVHLFFTLSFISKYLLTSLTIKNFDPSMNFKKIPDSSNKIKNGSNS